MFVNTNRQHQTLDECEIFALPVCLGLPLRKTCYSISPLSNTIKQNVNIF